MSRNINGRLKRLALAAARRKASSHGPGGFDDDGWLTQFEALEESGLLAGERDFSTALVEYREAIQRAKAVSDPPWLPPPGFMSWAPEPMRRRDWAHQQHADVKAAWWWLGAMGLRAQDGIPPVSIAEFEELAGWFNANKDRLLVLSRPSYLLDLGDGRQDSVANLAHALHKGPKGLHAGEAAESVRRLRVRFRCTLASD